MKFLRAFTARKTSPLPAPVVMTLAVDGRDVAITYKRHVSARRFTLRAARDGAGFIMTMPRRARLEDAEDFARRSIGWIRAALAKQYDRQEVADGASITFRGASYRIAATGRTRGHVSEDAEGKTLSVPGHAAHLRRRLTDWMKTEAAHELDMASHKYASAMGTAFRKITVRDQKSRWGSCSSDGTLSYSWRLIIAPAMVLDYVAAHEVAHLIEMNHGPRFWRLVLRHCPHTRDAQKWLKHHGNALHVL
ncbi:MAG: M48 family metallopeptidase [Proteobacteria bacterium]|nr:M48 family metallopeptidase [Pseudomonadota bacterium]